MAVAGAAAFYLENDRNASPAQVWNALLESASRNRFGNPRGSPNILLSTVDLALIPPTPAPSAMPTPAPTVVESGAPSRLPSLEPSSGPTVSESPSLAPTSSMQPSTSDQPSNVPSASSAPTSSAAPTSSHLPSVSLAPSQSLTPTNEPCKLVLARCDYDFQCCSGRCSNNRCRLNLFANMRQNRLDRQENRKERLANLRPNIN